MKAIRLRKLRRKYKWTFLQKSVIVEKVKTGRLEEFPNIHNALVSMFCEVFGLGVGFRYSINRAKRDKQFRLRNKLKTV